MSKCKTFCMSSLVVFIAVIVGVYYSWYVGSQRPVDPAADSILITGASSGIGRHAALAMNAKGFTVFAAVRKQSAGVALKEKAVFADKLIPVILDVTKQDHVDAAVKLVEEAVGENGLTVLYNNAGVYNQPKESRGNSIEVVDIPDYEYVFGVNTFGVARVTKAFIPLLAKSAKSRGNARVVINTSVAGIFAAAFRSVYAASKHATEAWAKSLRLEVLPKYGIDVSMIRPGLIFSEMTCKYLNKEKVQEIFDNYKGPYPEVEGVDVLGAFMTTMESPEFTSEALIDAALNSKPQEAYYMGGMATFARILASLPTKLSVMMLTEPPKEEPLTAEDWDEITSKCSEDWFNPDMYK